LADGLLINPFEYLPPFDQALKDAAAALAERGQHKISKDTVSATS